MILKIKLLLQRCCHAILVDGNKMTISRFVAEYISLLFCYGSCCPVFTQLDIYVFTMYVLPSKPLLFCYDSCCSNLFLFIQMPIPTKKRSIYIISRGTVINRKVNFWEWWRHRPPLTQKHFWNWEVKSSIRKYLRFTTSCHFRCIHLLHVISRRDTPAKFVSISKMSLLYKVKK